MHPAASHIVKLALQHRLAQLAQSVGEDLAVKVVDLVAQQTVHANTYTGTYREQRPISGAQFDNNIFQSLMKSALEQAAEDLYDMCKPGRRNKIRVTPLPEKKG